MLMLILIDGYNVIAPIAPPGRGARDRWLHDERQRLIDRLSAALPPEMARRTTIVFDAAAAPPGRESRFVQQGIQIEFAVGYAEADDRLEELIAAHSSPKRLTVVSSDHRVQTAARRRGALAIDSDQWLDRLDDGQLLLAISLDSPGDPAHSSAHEKPALPGEVDDWLTEFGIGDESSRKPGEIENPFPPGYGEDLL